jgi:hypothetical protein
VISRLQRRGAFQGPKLCAAHLMEHCERDGHTPYLLYQRRAVPAAQSSGRSNGVRLYHTTTAEAATAILRNGFNGVTAFFGVYALEGVAVPFTGVWVADCPVGIAQGAGGDPGAGDPVFVIALDETAIASYENRNEGTAYREWCIPASLATAHLLGMITQPADAEGSAAWWEAAEPHRPDVTADDKQQQTPRLSLLD